MIVYNLEDFVINELYRPYMTLVFPFLRGDEFYIRERAIRNDPVQYLDYLYRNPDAFIAVFGRLSELNFEFYKWLKSPIIDKIQALQIVYKEKYC